MEVGNEDLIDRPSFFMSVLALHGVNNQFWCHFEIFLPNQNVQRRRTSILYYKIKTKEVNGYTIKGRDPKRKRNNTLQ
jgi:hypothetical protein